ncbi:MAG: M91 family zinc metallopeptidase, partial [Candidatus Pacearchaeota archaeon]
MKVKGEDLGLYQKVVNHINEKYCENKLVINDIVLFEDGDCNEQGNKIIDNDGDSNKDGYYCYDNKKIYLNLDNKDDSIKILAHEIAHAYLDQIKGVSKADADTHKDPFRKWDNEFHQQA